MNTSILRQSGIYAILNVANGKAYVGSAVRFEKRWREHRATLKRGAHHSAKLQNAWNKYGAESFRFDVLEPVPDRAMLMAREQFWIDLLQSASRTGYNVQPYVGQGCRGMEIPPEVRAKTSATMRGRKYGPERCAAASAGLKGRKLSEEHKAKLRSKTLSPEHKAKLISANTGRKMSASALANRNKSNMARTFSEAQRAAISAALTGRKLSEAELAERRARRASEETRAKMSESQRVRWAARKAEAANA